MTGKEIEERRPLKRTPLVDRVLWMNAQGLGATEIAKLIDGSRQSVSNIINHPDAREIRDGMAAIQAEKLEAVVVPLLHKYARLHNLAADRLDELLNATQANGMPNIEARMTAIKLLLGSKISSKIFGVMPDEGDEKRAGGGATLTLNFEGLRAPAEVTLSDDDFREDDDVENR